MICKFRNSGQTCITREPDATCRTRSTTRSSSASRPRSRSSRSAPARAGRQRRPADRRGRAREGRAARRGRAGAGRRAASSAGARHELGGTFFQPTAAHRASAPAMAMTIEETFGPVAGITRFGDEREAIELANDTPYGLAAYFYSRDIGRIWRVSEGARDRHRRHQHRLHLERGRRRSAASRSRASGARARSTASRSGWKSSTSAWAASDRERRRDGAATCSSTACARRASTSPSACPARATSRCSTGCYDARGAIRFVTCRQEGGAGDAWPRPTAS